mmetsp:Transcript_22173/g.33839  ORF Transcript_22173/g.33839 Transcript_22173/m.33839 type:complete len:214 (-) Transcript_22173:216-857(-)|eukprot:CAMPEP_0118673848 /NCGR_PEP_ID=MMETSP0800-20121206/559_1 /TAXON_ID=210618 ORGANISM="Striatella unipunctata, Strain CCMP2910" /NCGR_SAMPLE_ID=MMETSP0800 /ASSEMBLY_ACC=CAM_ASM_000638 /LENGTH=213 /DNA_ID=CAMNT_0006568975 /DNA_START=248 /DNA_END=889 /DNA_ORIENTATION=-
MNISHAKITSFIEQHFVTTEHLRIIDIGTAAGGNADALAQKYPTATIVAVDPFAPIKTTTTAATTTTTTNTAATSDKFSNKFKRWASSHNTTMEELQRDWALGLLFDQRTRHGCRYHLLNASSDVAAEALLDVDKFDVVFVDGDHSYEGIKKEIKTYSEMLKPGGVLMLNEYSPDSFVGRAVADFVKRHKKASVVIGARHKPPGRTRAAIIVS